MTEVADLETFQRAQGGDRPAEFTTKSGNGRYLFVWKKHKD